MELRVYTYTDAMLSFYGCSNSSCPTSHKDTHTNLSSVATTFKPLPTAGHGDTHVPTCKIVVSRGQPRFQSKALSQNHKQNLGTAHTGETNHHSSSSCSVLFCLHALSCEGVRSWSYRQMEVATWVLGIVPESSGRAVPLAAEPSL